MSVYGVVPVVKGRPRALGATWMDRCRGGSCPVGGRGRVRGGEREEGGGGRRDGGIDARARKKRRVRERANRIRGQGGGRC